MEKAFLRTFGKGPAKQYAIDQIRYKDDDGSLLEVVNPLPEYTAEQVSGLRELFSLRYLSLNPLDRSGVWRYREFLPSFKPFDNVVTLWEGNTPIYPLPVCAQYAGMDALLAKHQGNNPTGSFKDNGMTTAVTMARKLGARMVACASTGNTSASMAAYAARARMKSIVFIPEGQIAYGKLSQALDYGALTIQINGDFDAAMNVVQDVCEKGNIYLLNSINPFRIEGQKTIMIEMLHQLGWSVPDWIIVPGGNLGNSSSFGKAFYELKSCGFIDKVPRLAIIQARGAGPLYKSYIASDRTLKPVHAQTRATAIKIGNPVSFSKAWYAVDYCDGIVEDVSEEDIAIAKSRIGADGIGSEPASATTVAGCKKLVEKGVIQKSDQVMCILTGHLLKDPDYSVEFHKDELYLDVERKTTVSGSQKIDTRGFSNKPVQLPADASVLLDYIEKKQQPPS
ncbi:MAG: threonine synthase [Chitinivibrionales bacterium]|nr:threonine synthase [Chitinivibrionales bacterium]